MVGVDYFVLFVVLFFVLVGLLMEINGMFVWFVELLLWIFGCVWGGFGLIVIFVMVCFFGVLGLKLVDIVVVGGVVMLVVCCVW